MQRKRQRRQNVPSVRGSPNDVSTMSNEGKRQRRYFISIDCRQSFISFKLLTHVWLSIYFLDHVNIWRSERNHILFQLAHRFRKLVRLYIPSNEIPMLLLFFFSSWHCSTPMCFARQNGKMERERERECASACVCFSVSKWRVVSIDLVRSFGTRLNTRSICYPDTFFHKTMSLQRSSPINGSIFKTTNALFVASLRLFFLVVRQRCCCLLDVCGGEKRRFWQRFTHTLSR